MGDVAEVAESSGKSCFFDFGVEELGVAGADGVGEVGEMVKVRGVGDGGFGLFVAAEENTEIALGIEVHVALRAVEVPGHLFGGVETAELADHGGAVGEGPGDVLGVGGLALIFITEATAGGADGDRESLFHAPTEDIDHMNAVVAEFAVAKIPEPVPVIGD